MVWEADVIGKEGQNKGNEVKGGNLGCGIFGGGFWGSYCSDSETNFTPTSNLRKGICRKRHNQSRENKLNNPQGQSPGMIPDRGMNISCSDDGHLNNIRPDVI